MEIRWKCISVRERNKEDEEEVEEGKEKEKDEKGNLWILNYDNLLQATGSQEGEGSSAAQENSWSSKTRKVQFINQPTRRKRDAVQIARIIKSGGFKTSKQS